MTKAKALSKKVATDDKLEDVLKISDGKISKPDAKPKKEPKAKKEPGEEGEETSRSQRAQAACHELRTLGQRSHVSPFCLFRPRSDSSDSSRLASIQDRVQSRAPGTHASRGHQRDRQGLENHLGRGQEAVRGPASRAQEAVRLGLGGEFLLGSIGFETTKLTLDRSLF
jgi:hypothetical protein